MSRTRSRKKGPSRPRDKHREAQARETQAAQQRAEAKRQITPGAYRFRRAAGWTLVGLAIVVGAGHWLTHIGAWGFASQGMMDLVAGYPAAMLLGIAGAIVLSR